MGHSVAVKRAPSSQGRTFHDSANSVWYAPPYGPFHRLLAYAPLCPVALVKALA